MHPMKQSRDDTNVRNCVDALQAYPERFFSYFRVQLDTFRYVLNAVQQRIERMDTNIRRLIDPETRLYVTLHYLSSGSSYHAIPMHYALGRSTVSKIIFDTCKAIVDLLGPIYISNPQ